MEEPLVYRGFGIEQRLRSFARLITQDFGLKVTFQGEVASLGKEGMQIPPVQDTKEAFSRAKFYVSHECGHALHSDFSVIEKAAKEDKRLPAILNSLEDARIEKLMIKEFPGLETDISENIQAIVKEWDTFSMSLPTQLVYGMYLLGREYEIAMFSQDAQNLLIELQSHIERASEAFDCRTVLEEARKILSKIDNLLKASPEVVTDDGYSPSDKPPLSVTAQTGEEIKEAQIEVDDINDDTLEERPTTVLSDEGREQLEETDFSGSSISDLIKARFDEVKLAKDYDGMQNYEFLKDENAPEEETIHSPQEGDLSDYHRLLNPLLVEYNFLKRELEKIVSQKRTKKRRMAYKRGEKQGVIDTKGIWKIATSEDNIFKKRKAGEASRTLQVDPDSLAIYILLDESGSMEEKDRIEYAQKAAIIIAETLHSLEIPFALTGYTVCGQLVRICYKDFWDDFKNVKPRLLSVRNRDGTYTAEHLPFAKRRLGQRKERKRLLIVITDATDIESEVRLRKAMQELKNTGIFVIGIGIHTNLMASYYDKFIEIEEIQGFAKELLSLLKTVLIG